MLSVPRAFLILFVIFGTNELEGARLLPDWKPPNSDYKILPIAAYRLSDSKTLAGKAQSSGSDLGGRFELAHFNLFGKNPGLTFEFTDKVTKSSHVQLLSGKAASSSQKSDQ